MNVEPESGTKMDLDDSGCVQDGCSPSKSEQSEDIPMRKLELLDFSDEVLFYILKFCTPHSLKALGFTCSRLGALVLERSLWNHVDARDICTNRARMRWMVQNFHVGTRAVLVHGHANEARGCRGHVNRTRQEAEDDKPRFASELSCSVQLDERAPDAEIEVPLAPAPEPEPYDGPLPNPMRQPEPALEVVEYGAAGPNGAGRPAVPLARYPLRRLPARLHMNALNAAQPLPRHRGSPTWPEDCEWDDEEEPAQESSEDTAGCGGPVFTLSADIMRELCIRCPRLYELNLEYCNINCNKINLSSFPTALRKLSLKGTRCYNPPLDKSYLFRIHDYLPVLEHLDLSECAWLEPAALLPLSKMAHLRALLMRACPAMAEFVAYVSLATRYGFRKLKVLDMRESPVGDSEVSALGWLPELEELYLSAPPSPAPRSPAPHHHYIGDPLPRRPPLDVWETMIPPYYMSRCEEGCDSPDAGDDLEAQLNALQHMPPLSIEVRTRLRLPSRNQPPNPPNPPPDGSNPQPALDRPSCTQCRRSSDDAPGPPRKRSRRDSGSKHSDDDSDTDDDDDDDDRDDGAEMDATGDGDNEWIAFNDTEEGAGSHSDSSPDKAKRSSEDESRSRYRIFKHKNMCDDTAGPSKDDDKEAENSAKPPETCRRYVYRLNYGPLSDENYDRENSDKQEDPKRPNNEDKDKTVNDGASSSKDDTKMEVNEGPSSSKDNTKMEVNDGASSSKDDTKIEVNDGASSSKDNTKMEINDGASSSKEDTKIEINEGATSSKDDTKMEVNEGPRPSKDNRKIELNEGPSSSEDAAKMEVNEGAGTSKDDEVNEGASSSKDNVKEIKQIPESSEDKADKVIAGEEDKPKTENNGKEEECEEKTEPSDAKTEKCNVNEGASGSRDTNGDSAENRPEGGSVEESNEPKPGPSNADGKTTYRCRIDVQDGASTSRYSIRVQVKNELLHDGQAPPPVPPQPPQGDPPEEPPVRNEEAGENIPEAREVPPEEPPASPPARRVRFMRDRPPVVLRVPAGQRADQQVEPRHHVLYVNLGQQLHAVYRLLPHRVPVPAPPRAPPADHLEANSLVSDASIRRFGRADGENVNIVNIGPNGPQFGARDNSGRPNRSSLRILSATGYRNITNRSLAHLATAAPRLRFLDLSATGVTADGVEQFKSLRADVQVTYSEFKSEDVEE